MKKKTLGIVLNVFIVLLVLMNALLIVMIMKRGSEPLRDEELQQTETPVVVESDNVTPTPTPVPEAEQEEIRELVAIPTTKVNVRSKAGTDGDKLGSAEETEEFVVSEVHDEWTKLDYKGKEAFIKNEYLKYRYRITNGAGEVSYEDADVNELKKTL
ncbi:MAG: SH3 domain-containing protein [Lachnospiraceae bacterium]|nr:SH3 domain-containing protein [Lachnospiraceae bacterium]